MAQQKQNQYDAFGNPIAGQAPQGGAFGLGSAMSQPQSTPGSNAFTAGAQAPGATPGSANSWTNLQSYLGLNPNAGKEMGNDILGPQSVKAGSPMSMATASLQGAPPPGIRAGMAAAPSPASAGTQGGTSYWSGVTPPTSGGIEGQAAYVAGKIGQANSLPSSYASTAQGEIAPLANQTQENLNLLKTPAGQQTLLREQYGSGSQSGYGPGESGLDQLLFGGANQGRISNDITNYGNIGQQLEGISGTAPPAGPQQPSPLPGVLSNMGQAFAPGPGQGQQYFYDPAGGGWYDANGQPAPLSAGWQFNPATGMYTDQNGKTYDPTKRPGKS